MTPISQTCRKGMIAGVFAVLSACADIPLLPTDLPSSPTAGPGAQPAAPAEAGRLFAKACLETLPTFAGTGAALAAEPFTINSRFGTYYHNQLNLSIKLLPPERGGYCSIVFGSSLPADRAFAAFAAGVDSVGDFDATVDLRPPRPGSNLFNARTNAQ